MNELSSQNDPDNWFDEHQKLLIEQYYLAPLRQRIQDLEGQLVYCRNFLPQSLKQTAEEVLWPNRNHLKS
jgi:hypothetical protein